MPENELVRSNNLPQKSTLWIAGNIAAGVLLITAIVKFVGGIIISPFILGDFILELIYAIVIILTGIWLGSKLGVQYVRRRSIIDSLKIETISKITAIFPFAFYLLTVIEDIYVVSTGAGKFEFSFAIFITTLISVVATFFFVRNFLWKSTQNLNQVDRVPQPADQISSSSNNVLGLLDKSNTATKRILIGIIILAVIGTSTFIILGLKKKNTAPISEIKIIEDFSSPEATIKTFLKAYEVKNKDLLLRNISKKSLEELDEMMRFSTSLDVNEWNSDFLSQSIKADYKIAEQTDKFAIVAPQNRELITEYPFFKNLKTPRVGDIFFVNEENFWKIDIYRTFWDVNIRSLYLNGYKTYPDGSTDIEAEAKILNEGKDKWRKSFDR